MFRFVPKGYIAVKGSFDEETNTFLRCAHNTMLRCEADIRSIQKSCPPVFDETGDLKTITAKYKRCVTGLAKKLMWLSRETLKTQRIAFMIGSIKTFEEQEAFVHDWSRTYVNLELDPSYSGEEVC